MTAPLPPNPPTFPWEGPYMAAVLETDDAVLPERLREAERAVTERLISLPDLHENDEERQALERALEGIARLQRERLNHLDNTSAL